MKINTYHSSILVASIAATWFICAPDFEPVIVFIAASVGAVASKEESTKGLDQTKITKRNKDVESIRLLIKNISVTRFNRNIEQHKNRAIHFNDIMYLSFVEEGLKEFSDSSPVIHNKNMDKLVIQFTNGFHDFLNFASNHFAQAGDSEIYNALTPSSYPTYERWEKENATFQRKANNLEKTFRTLVTSLRENYLDMNLDYLSDAAESNFSKYLSYVKPENETM